jgi:hypothetical protein
MFTLTPLSPTVSEAQMGRESSTLAYITKLPSFW